MAFGIVNVKSANSSNGSGVFLADVSAVSASSGNGQISLKWSDPENVTISGNTVATWVGTLVIRKAGEIPADRNDGTVVTNNTSKNAYATTALVDTGLTNGTVYYYRFFPYSNDGNYTSGSSISGRPGATSVPIPTITSTHTYDTTAQTPTLSNFDGTIMSKSGNTTETNANEDPNNPYVITVSLTSTNVVWADGTYEDKHLTWNMSKAENIPVIPTPSSATIRIGSNTTFTASAAGTGKISVESTNPAVATASCPNASGSVTVTVTSVGGGGTAIIVKVAETDNYKEGINYFGISVTRQVITIPTVSNTSKTYNGSEQHPTVSNEPSSALATRKGTYAATNASTASGNVYTFSYEINDPSTYEWDDGTTTAKSFNWTLAQKTGTLSLSPTALTLNNSETTGTITISGEGGNVSVVTNSNPSILATAISGNTLTVTKQGSTTGVVTLTLSRAGNQNYTASATAQATITVNHYRTMTVKIDQSNSNPDTCCTYADDASSMTAGSSAWDTFFGHYPCLMAGGVEGVKLNPNNYDKDINGNAVTINSGSNDVMVAFPRRGLKMSTSGNVITISMTDNPNDSNFEYMAHKRGSTLKDKFYLGAYMGSEISSKLRSLKGQTIANNKTIGSFRTLARANSPASNGSGGSGYDQHGFYQLLYLQCMFVLKYKTLNSQSAVGRGFVDGNSAQKATGGTETKGLDWGETTGKDHMKIFGIEDLWGNVWSWIDGLFSDSSRNILTNTQSFNDTGSGYTNRGASGFSSDSGGYLSKVQGGTHTGFVAKTFSGSESTYFCDDSYLYASRLPYFGGSWAYGSAAGVFYLNVHHTSSSAYANVGSRLMFL